MNTYTFKSHSTGYRHNTLNEYPIMQSNYIYPIYDSSVTDIRYSREREKFSNLAPITVPSKIEPTRPTKRPNDVLVKSVDRN